MTEAERLVAQLAELRAMQVALEHYRKLLQLPRPWHAFGAALVLTILCRGLARAPRHSRATDERRSSARTARPA